MSFALALLAIVAVYAQGWRKLRRTLPNSIGVRQLAMFMAGLSTLWAAVASPLAPMDHRFLTAHMAQHLVLMTLAAPFLLLGSPVIVILHGLPAPGGQQLSRFFQGSRLQKLASVFTHPTLTWLAGTGTVIVWHVPALFQAGMQSQRWHTIEQASFVIAGLLFWRPVIGPLPSVARWADWSAVLYLFLATLPCDALSAFLTFCDRIVYPHYRQGDPSLNAFMLSDQEIAGALMWLWVTFAYLAPAAVITTRALSSKRQDSCQHCCT